MKQPPSSSQEPSEDLQSDENADENADESLRTINRDPERTNLIKLPDLGPVRSRHGTIELVVQKSGRILTPEYTATGILKSVTTNDGLKFVMTPDRKTWCILDRCGDKINEEPIKSVYFDKKGNFIYIAESGKRTTMQLDGSTVVD